MYEDKTLTCKDCGKEFVFTAGEQEFYAEKGLVNEPQRCKECRVARKNAIRGASAAAFPQHYFHVCIFVCVERYLEGDTPYFFLKIVMKWLRDEKPS